jgi:NADH dehydrogenase (ubiquinone) 1 alpha/beta subcomplex 1
MLEAENEFFIEFPDEEVERFKNLNDVVEYVARSFYAV